MQVGVGYSDNPSSTLAGKEAVRQALASGGRDTPCDAVLLFCTARHNQAVLRGAVAGVVGAGTPIYGGGAVGVITGETFGYAGDQVGVACLWMDEKSLDVLTETGLLESEKATGERLGQKLKDNGVTADSPVMLFYDAVDSGAHGVRLLMATWILEGLRQGLGFWPNSLTGAGLQGDHVCTPSNLFDGDGMVGHAAMALSFPGDIRIDAAIMHGCRPASQYYTVTKAEGPVILEINNQPAIDFLDGILGPAITPAQYPFFLLFGINHGEKWGEYDENSYASRLCMGLDMERRGLVMFEPDMVAGTRFQLMYRSLDLDYMRPKIEALFDGLDGREPVFGMYIDCAGRCAGYGGLDMEDALVVQQTVAGRVPLLGLYTGVEIAPTGGRPRGLDWTGVFCLFSQSRQGGQTQARPAAKEWDTDAPASAYDDVPVQAALAMGEQNAAKVLQLDTQLIATRHELEQKRRGFSLLAELVVLLREAEDYQKVFTSVAQRINAALNMQKTAVLFPDDGGGYLPLVLQGYSEEEKRAMAGRPILLDGGPLGPDDALLATAADSGAHLAGLRAALGLPYLIAVPIVLKKEVVAVLVTGRLSEQPPFLSRLGVGDVETVRAVVALMASILMRQQLDEAEQRASLMLDATPLCANFWDENHRNIDCNRAAVELFELADKQEYLDRFYELSPEFQPNGRPSAQMAEERIKEAFATGRCVFEWMHQKLNGEPVPAEITLVRMRYKRGHVVIGFTRDLRQLKAQMAEIEKTQADLREARDRAEESSRAKTNFLANMSHEIRTPMNAIMGMTTIAKGSDDLEQVRQYLAKTEVASSHLLGIINDVLDMSKIDAGKFTLSPADFTVEHLLQRVANVINFKVEEKQQQFVIKVDSDVPTSIVADEQRLAQVITNLLSNAVKFTPEGGKITLLVHKTAEEDGLCTLYFEVADTGIGVEHGQEDHLFSSFEQADGSISRRFGGTGLGLAISKSIVEMMDGRIWLESEPGKGSNFQFTIRAKRGLSRQAGRLSAGVDWQRVRVMVVEDDPKARAYFVDIATGAGLTCAAAHSAAQAWQMLEKDADWQVVFVSGDLADADGLGLAAKIRAEKGIEAVVLMITEAGWALVEDKARAAGVERYITKPILPSPVIDCINECLGAGPAAKEAAGQAEEGDTAGLFAGKRVLLAEDIDVNREIVMVLLDDTGVQLDAAENGLVALEKFKADPAAYDAILMDIHMPEMDGYEATRQIRAMDAPQAKSVPIIAMTANVFKEDIEKCLEAGMNDHIGKPLDIDELMAKLQKYL